MFDFLNMYSTYESRKVARWEDPNSSTIVDTTSVTDGKQPYETAVCNNDYNDGKWVIVQAYDTVE